MNWEKRLNKKIDKWNNKLEKMSKSIEDGSFDVDSLGEKALFKAVDTAEKYDNKRKKWKKRFEKVDKKIQKFDETKTKVGSWVDAFFGEESNLAINIDIAKCSDNKFKVLLDGKCIYVIKKTIFSSEKSPVFKLKNIKSKEPFKISKAGYFKTHRTKTGKRPTLLVFGVSFSGKIYAEDNMKNTYASTEGEFRIVGNILTNDYRIEKDDNTLARATGNINNGSVHMNLHNQDDLDSVIIMWTSAYIFDRYIIGEGINLRNID